MRNLRLTFAAALIPLLAVSSVLAQSPPAQEPQAVTPTPAAPSLATTVAPALTAKDLEGVDVFGSDGQQIGKVTKVDEANGKVTSVEVKSPGLFGFFAKTYVVPAEKLNKKDGRVELTMTSDEGKQLAK
jgi:sporulation protein YlmC with PRC-barrel domain